MKKAFRRNQIVVSALAIMIAVAGGGDNPVVIKDIQEAVQVLFQVEAHKIKVMKMN